VGRASHCVQVKRLQLFERFIGGLVSVKI
jgi:hypothetical protein